MANKTAMAKDLANKKLVVTREFDAPVEKVWQAWTTSNLLDQWWAPRPWKAETKSLDFREGGVWLYYMQGPEGDRHWCRFDYKTIDPQKSYTGADAFCDENGTPTNVLPSTNWQVHFNGTATGTRVETTLTFSAIEDLEKIIAMGFEQGFTAAHGNLDELLAGK